ncbi:hypothetical protein GCM10010218_19180 [Streptomyces mashuensis]|uniref:Integral membrane protein n=1 Tax=Streptomyces mashuensis TaxID=33904 RepID=A0A919B2F2_9ACTN|nr:hypothetical protein GCM10010218_19180 [Streptomyces mashuensis]
MCVLLAALGHAVMSGSHVPWWAVGVALSGTASCAWFLAGRERGPLLVTLATVGAQTALHFFFSVAQAVASAAPGVPPVSAPSTAVCGAPPQLMPGAAGPHDMGGMTSVAGHAGHGALGMWSAHVLVAVVCGIWLSGGEQAAFRLGRTLAARLFAPLLLLFRAAPSPWGPPRVRAGAARAAQRLRQLLYGYVLARRGPPAGVVAFC